MYRFVLFFIFSMHFSCSSSNDNLDKPKLIVAIVVDQMRYDFLENLSDRYTKNGFNRLINEGYNCKNNFYNYNFLSYNYDSCSCKNFDRKPF